MTEVSESKVKHSIPLQVLTPLFEGLAMLWTFSGAATQELYKDEHARYEAPLP